MTNLRRTTLSALAFAFGLTAAPGVRGEHEKELLKTKARVAYLTPDGKILAAASNDNVRLVYLDIKKSRLLAKKYEPIYLSPDGKVLASGGNDKVLRLWDTSLISQHPRKKSGRCA